MILSDVHVHQRLRIHRPDVNVLHLFNTHKKRPPEFLSSKGLGAHFGIFPILEQELFYITSR